MNYPHYLYHLTFVLKRSNSTRKKIVPLAFQTGIHGVNQTRMTNGTEIFRDKTSEFWYTPRSYPYVPEDRKNRKIPFYLVIPSRAQLLRLKVIVLFRSV